MSIGGQGRPQAGYVVTQKPKYKSFRKHQDALNYLSTFIDWKPRYIYKHKGWFKVSDYLGNRSHTTID